MAIHKLTLSDFRCYEHMRMDIEEGPVVLTGSNGSGKTNILEALSFLSPGRGMRNAAPTDIIRRTAPAHASWAVAVSAYGLTGPIDIGTGRDGVTNRRLLRLNGQAAKNQAALGDVLSILWLTPVMDRLFSDGSSGRRRFLDRLVFAFSSAHAGHLSQYDHALKERARLLRLGRLGTRPDPTWLDHLEKTMAEHAIEVARARLETIASLNTACGQGLGPFPAASLTISGFIEDALAEEKDSAASSSLFLAALKDNRRLDSEQGGARVGPHKTDMNVLHAARGIDAVHCSTGEQKALLIAIILGQARLQQQTRGAAPILLLDEVAAHLDVERRAALFEELLSLKTQTWLTGTDATVFDGLGSTAQFFCVHDATLTPISGKSA